MTVNPFHFRNFEPDQRLTEIAESILKQITEIAPYNSTISAFMKSDDDGGYWSAMDIYCLPGPFIARTRASTPHEALQLLKERITDKIASWKLNRNFDHAAA